MTRKVSQLKAGVILSYFSKMVQLLVGILYTPIMIRLLGQSEYGLYNIAASLISYLGILNLGFGSAYIRFYSRYRVAKDREKISSLNGMFLTLFSLLGVVAVVSGIILALNVDIIFGPSLNSNELKKAQILMIILVINLGISFPNIVFNTYVQANEHFIAQNLLLIFRQLSTPMINLPLLIAGHGSVGMVVGTTMINILTEIVTVIYCFKKLNMKITFNNFDRALFKEMSVYSFYIFINMIVDQVNNNVDKTILGRYQGVTSVAIYSVGVNLTTYYNQVSSSVSTVFIPRIHRMVASKVNNLEITKLFTKVGRIQFILLSMVSLGFVFLGKQFISFWVGNDYMESYYISLVLMITITIPGIQNLGIEVQRAKNQHQFRSWMYLFLAIGNIIISIPLSQRFGSLGAASGTALSYVLGHGIAMNWYNHQYVGIDMKYFWKEIFSFNKAFILPIVYGIVINYYGNVDSLKKFLISGFTYVIIFSLSMWFYGLNDYEKKLISKRKK